MSTEMNDSACPTECRRGAPTHLALLVTLALFVGLCLGLAACDGQDTSEGEGAESGSEQSGSEAEPEPEATPAPCTFARATRTLRTLNIESADGSCTVLLPSEVEAGELAVAATAGASAAAVEIRASEDSRYYATEGSVTVQALENGRIRGEFTVSDTNPPETGGPWTGSFDVELGSGL